LRLEAGKEKRAMTPIEFAALVAPITQWIGDRALDAGLEADLNRTFPPEDARFRSVFDACRAGVAAGWMCNREGGGIKYGRVVKPGGASHGFSVDVVEMENLAGPHHRHPEGEIDMIMPLEGSAKFDGRGAGWLVYGPGSAHRPTVSDGKALVLYLLPKGRIEFSGA
jgi:uncharacterized protein DUF4863